jgi:hypothetical protein
MLPTITHEAIVNVAPSTAISVALGSPPVQAALLNLLVAAAVRLTSHLVAKRRARRATKKYTSNV